MGLTSLLKPELANDARFGVRMVLTHRQGAVQMHSADQATRCSTTRGRHGKAVATGMELVMKGVPNGRNVQREEDERCSKVCEPG